MRQAAVALIIRDGLILGIARKNDPSKFGLIGGKSDNNEHPVQTAQRECLEEVGIEINAGREIFVREDPASTPEGEDFYTHCFYAFAWNGEPKNLEGTEVRWLTAAELISSEMGAFPDYNTKTLEAFRKLYPDVKLKGEK